MLYHNQHWCCWCMCTSFYLTILICSTNLSQIGAYFDNTGYDTEPRQKTDATTLGLRFEGNKSAPNYFKLLERDDDSLLIGARNVVYNISINTFDVQTMIYWPSLDEDSVLCTMKGKSKEDCHNYIRILAKDNETGILVCGTNSFKPLCRIYQYKDGNYEMESQFSASGITPYDPSHNSTFYYMTERFEIYSGTVADFAGTDALISKRKITKPEDLGLRTERSDIKCLNEPNFVSSFADQDHVYFWFRENAVEYMNCGKAIYSRVARVCKNDRGGPRAYSDSWTTFLKARLNCSLPGEYPFYFDEIAATSGIVAGTGKDGTAEPDLIYAVFNTPYSALRGSAVCAFSLREIRRIFRYSSFKTQNNPDSNWLPLMRTQVPQPRPGDCETDSRLLTDEAMNFVRKNPLLDDVVPNHFSAPLIVQTGFKRFTHITVDSQVISVDGKKYDVIFVATDDGKVLKLVNLASANSVLPEIMQIFNQSISINNMLIYRASTISSPSSSTLSQDIIDHPTNDNVGGRLILVTDEEVRSIPLYNCHRAQNCHACVRLQDPYCAWDVQDKTCVGSSNGNWTNGKFLQNVTGGFSIGCFAESPPDFMIPPDSSYAAAFNPMNLFSLSQNKSNASSASLSAINSLCKCGSSYTETYSSNQQQQISPKFTNGDNELNFNQKAGVVYASSQKITEKNLYPIESLIVSVVVTMLISLLIGLFGGLHLSKYKFLLKWTKKDFFCKNGSKKPIFPMNGIHKHQHQQQQHPQKKPTSKKKDIVDAKLKKDIIHANGHVMKPAAACLSVNAQPINAYDYESSRPVNHLSIFGGQRVTTPLAPSYEDTVVSRNYGGDHDDNVDIKLSDTVVPMVMAGMMNGNVSNLSNYCTLPKDYKVKKTYL